MLGDSDFGTFRPRPHCGLARRRIEVRSACRDRIAIDTICKESVRFDASPLLVRAYKATKVEPSPAQPFVVADEQAAGIRSVEHVEVPRQPCLAPV